MFVSGKVKESPYELDVKVLDAKKKEYAKMTPAQKKASQDAANKKAEAITITGIKFFINVY